VAGYLREAGRINACHYHAGMSHKQRMEVQNGWQAGRVAVIVATIAFGEYGFMGRRERCGVEVRVVPIL